MQLLEYAKKIGKNHFFLAQNTLFCESMVFTIVFATKKLHIRGYKCYNFVVQKNYILFKTQSRYTFQKLLEKNLLANFIEHSWQRNYLNRFLYRFSGIRTFPLPSGCATESELTQHNCLLVRRKIGWLGFLGENDQSKNNFLPKTKLKSNNLHYYSFLSMTLTEVHVYTEFKLLKKELLHKLLNK